jgi:hypothetical protein
MVLKLSFAVFLIVMIYMYSIHLLQKLKISLQTATWPTSLFDQGCFYFYFQ